jgi:uncharacterized protein YciI
MRKLVFGVILLLSSAAFAQHEKFPPGLEIPDNMKQYFVVFLVADRTTPPKEPDGTLLKAHLASIRANIEAGKYILAGPFIDHERIDGMFIVNAANKDEAMQLVSADPIVKAGLAKVEMHPAMLPDLSSLKVTYPPKHAQ